MGKEDYASTGTSPPQHRAAFQTNTQEGGSLKLKGAKDSGIKKKKKKSRDKALTEARSENPEGERAISAAEENESDRGKGRESGGAGEPDGDDDDGVETGAYYAGKTDAERRFEERKRKRVSGGGGVPFAGPWANNWADGRETEAGGNQEPQAARRRVQQVPEQPQRTPRHVCVPPRLFCGLGGYRH